MICTQVSWVCVECLASCQFLGIQSEKEEFSTSVGFMKETLCKLTDSRTVSAKDRSWGRSQIRWCTSLVHSRIRRIDADLPGWAKRCSKPLGYVSKQDGQDPHPWELLYGKGDRNKTVNLCVCVRVCMRVCVCVGGGVVRNGENLKRK